MLVYYELLTKKHTRKVYGGGALKVDVAQISEYELQVGVQAERFERVTEQFGNKKAIFVVLVHYCACALVTSFR